MQEEREDGQLHHIRWDGEREYFGEGILQKLGELSAAL